MTEQNKKSGRWFGGTFICRYRSTDGTSCSKGCLFTDEEYNPKLEGGNISALIDDDLAPKRLLCKMTMNLNLNNGQQDST